MAFLSNSVTTFTLAIFADWIICDVRTMEPFLLIRVVFDFDDILPTVWSDHTDNPAKFVCMTCLHDFCQVLARELS